MAWASRSVPPVWAVALLGAIAIAVWAGPAFLLWTPVLLAGCVLLTFVIQLSLQRKEGLVDRIVASVGGALVVLVVATVALAIGHPSSLPWAG